MAHYVSGSAAINYDGAFSAYPQPSPQPRRRFRVVEGAHAAPTSTPLSPLAVTAIKCAIGFIASLAVVAVIRILVIALAFGVASSNAVLANQLESARALGNELEVQQAVYGRSDRIIEIATGVYGMVPMQGTAIMDLSDNAADEAFLTVEDSPTLGASA